MIKFPFIIVEFCRGGERTIAGAVDLTTAQWIWRALEDAADKYTRYVILNEKQHELVGYEDRECELSTNDSWTNSESNGNANTADEVCISPPTPTICSAAEPVVVHESTYRST